MKANDDDEELLEVLFVFEDEKAIQREVKTGISDFENIQILEGATEGEQVISGPFLAISKRLEDDMDVTIKEEEEDEDED